MVCYRELVISIRETRFSRSGVRILGVGTMEGNVRGAVLVAVAATIGNLLQGWDNSTVAGAVLYVKREFDLQNQPTMEGLLVATSLIGGMAITVFSGPLSDALGRRPMMVLSSVLYFLSSLIMLWSPNVYVLLLGRLFAGFGTGLAVTQVPLYISETAPSEIRGLLNTIPQFTGSGGMFLSYCMVFGVSLLASPSWRMMFGILSLPSFVYFVVTTLFLPESPRWLVSKGKIHEAKRVLQKLRGRDDVSGELALLIEGLNIGVGETSIEEYMVLSTKELNPSLPYGSKKDQMRLYDLQRSKQYIEQSPRNAVPGDWSGTPKSIPFMDPIVPMFGSVNHTPLESSALISMLLPNFGNVLADGTPKKAHLDLESHNVYEDDTSDDGGDCDDSLQMPLLVDQASTNREGVDHPNSVSQASNLSSQVASKILLENDGEPVESTDIGSGWKLAWKRDGGLKRIFLHQQDSNPVSPRFTASGVYTQDENEFNRVAALVSRSALSTNKFLSRPMAEPILAKQEKSTTVVPIWQELLDPGVMCALFVGIGLQVLQQASGINGVLYYTPQILKQAGVDVLLSNLGLSTDSAPFLVSCLMALSTLPCIAVAMKLMDVSGRRSLLLSTIPILVISLLSLVVANITNLSSISYAIISVAGVMVYVSSFVMAFGVIPNIICSEIFPTKVRGLCITICSLTYWVGNICVTYSVPVMLNSIGMAGLFTIYAAGCLVSWIFVFLRVPETKGMPLEVISELFAARAKQAREDAPAAAATNER